MTASVAGVVAAGAGLVRVASAQVMMANANGSRVCVYPTGDPVADTQNVQAAIDAVTDGGTVLLKAMDAGGAPRAFDFGSHYILNQFRIVILNKSVTLEGETVRRAKTTLLRGVALFKIQSTSGHVVKIRNLFSQGASGFFHGVYGDVDFEIDSVDAVDMMPTPAGTILGFLGHNSGRYCVRNCTYRSAVGAAGVKWEGGISHYPFGAAAIVEYVNNDVEVPLRSQTWGLCVLSNSGSGILVKSNRVKASQGLLLGAPRFGGNAGTATVMNNQFIVVEGLSKDGIASGIQTFDADGVFVNNSFAGPTPGADAYGMIVAGNRCVIRQNDFSEMTLAGTPGKPCLVLRGQHCEVYEHPRQGEKLFPSGTSLCQQVLNEEPGADPTRPETWTNYIHHWDKYCG